MQLQILRSEEFGGVRLELTQVLEWPNWRTPLEEEKDSKAVTAETRRRCSEVSAVSRPELTLVLGWLSLRVLPSLTVQEVAEATQRHLNEASAVSLPGHIQVPAWPS